MPSPDPSSPASEREIFAVAVELPACERAAYLDEACVGRASVRAGVEYLLASLQDDAFMQGAADSTTTPEVEAELARLKPEKAGERIGNYRLCEKIGEGGFGTVWVAEQERPVRRRVALKIIKLGMDTNQVIARFEQERQALAMMDHPNIAKVLDAGATSFGRPYFVMELVRGIKITKYCDQANLPTAARLHLFITVCQAVQHAHQKGIIHRDLKPSNILVTLHDGAPVPKVIDFGVAKATQQQRLTDLTIYTQFEQMIGTPLYMSPEQAEMSGLDIDTRSDIYSLGVLLYELLVGNTPFDPEYLMKSGLDEMRRVIREQEPLKPSTVISTMADALRTDLAQHRQTDSDRLVRQIRGDLDWIVMKALEKDRARRYETANSMARDIERHLNDEPIHARPASRLYRFRRFARRNKGFFAASTAVMVALVSGLGVSTWMFFQEKHARDLQDHERRKAVAEARKAESAARKSEQVAQFLKNMLKGVDPSVAMGRDTTILREILESTLEDVGKNLENQPDVEADLRTVIGEVFLSLGDYGKAETILRESLVIREREFGHEHPAVAESLCKLASVLDSKAELDEAEQKFREAIAIQTRVLGAECRENGDALIRLAHVMRFKGKLVEAETTAREGLAINRKLLGNDHPIVAGSLIVLAQAVGAQGRDEDAVPFHREALRVQRKLHGGKDHPEVADSLVNLSQPLRALGRLDEAEATNREGLAIFRRVYGNQHAITGDSVGNLGDVLHAQEKFAEAEGAFSEAAAIATRVFGLKDPRTFRWVHALAAALFRQNKLTEAEALERNHLAAMRQQFGNDPAVIVFAERTQILQHKRRIEEALKIDDREKLKQATNELHSTLQREDAEAKPLLADAALTRLQLCALLLYLGDLDTYRTVCAELAETSKGTLDASVAERVARAVFLSPQSGVDPGTLEPLVRVLRVGVHAGFEIWSELLSMLADYRSGNFQACVAIGTALDAHGASHPEVKCMAASLVAMAEQRSGHPVAAAAALKAARSQLVDHWQTQESWWDWMTASLLLSEAQQLVEGPSPILK